LEAATLDLMATVPEESKRLDELTTTVEAHAMKAQQDRANDQRAGKSHTVDLLHSGIWWQYASGALLLMGTGMLAYAGWTAPTSSATHLRPAPSPLVQHATPSAHPTPSRHRRAPTS
jgi:hypothetical protein